MKYFLFFVFLMSSMVLSSQQAKAGIGIPEYERHSRASCGFFVRKISVLHHYVGLGGLSKEGPVLVPVCQPIQPGSMIGIVLPGLKTFYEIPIMKPSKSAQSEQTTTQNLEYLSQQFCTTAFYAGAVFGPNLDKELQQRRLKLFANAARTVAETAMRLHDEVGGAL